MCVCVCVCVEIIDNGGHVCEAEQQCVFCRERMDVTGTDGHIYKGHVQKGCSNVSFSYFFWGGEGCVCVCVCVCVCGSNLFEDEASDL